jgi:hypothetical protein
VKKRAADFTCLALPRAFQSYAPGMAMTLGIFERTKLYNVVRDSCRSHRNVWTRSLASPAIANEISIRPSSR